MKQRICEAAHAKHRSPKDFLKISLSILLPDMKLHRGARSRDGRAQPLIILFIKHQLQANRRKCIES